MDFFLEDQDDHIYLIKEFKKLKKNFFTKLKQNNYFLYLITNKENIKEQILFLSYNADEIFNSLCFVKSITVKKYKCPINVDFQIKEILYYKIENVPIVFGFEIECTQDLLTLSSDIDQNTTKKMNSRLLFYHSHLIIRCLFEIEFIKAIKSYLYLSALEHSCFSLKWKINEIVKTGNIASSILLGFPYLKQYSIICDDLYYASNCFLKKEYNKQNNI